MLVVGAPRRNAVGVLQVHELFRRLPLPLKLNQDVLINNYSAALSSTFPLAGIGTFEIVDKEFYNSTQKKENN